MIGKVVVPKASIVIPAYDKKGHLIGTVDADGKLKDANGHVIGEVDADGTVRNAEGDVIGKTGVNMAAGFWFMILKVTCWVLSVLTVS